MTEALLSEWQSFMNGSFTVASHVAEPTTTYPAPSKIHLSTQTFITQLNRNIDLKEMFWGLDLISYDRHEVGISKKQMKFTSTTQEEVDDLMQRMEAYPVKQVFVIRKIVTPDKFKDIRKVSIGMSKKDLAPNRVKPKGAFFNCLVVNVRIGVEEGVFKDHHVKLFNTGNVEIPGIQDAAHVPLIMEVVEKCVRRIHPIDRVPDCKIVLINSHFNIHFFINRDKLYMILRQKYGVAAVYDPCSYPGVQCKLYYTPELEIVTRASPFQTSSVSVMIFRTGSVLVVGKCNEDVIHAMYAYLNKIFEDNFAEVADRSMDVKLVVKKEKKQKKWIIKK